jgi:hypothetical protein
LPYQSKIATAQPPGLLHLLGFFSTSSRTLLYSRDKQSSHPSPAHSRFCIKHPAGRTADIIDHGIAFKGKERLGESLSAKPASRIVMSAFSEAFSSHHGVEHLFRAEPGSLSTCTESLCSDILRFCAIALCLHSPKIPKHANVSHLVFFLLPLHLLRMQIITRLYSYLLSKDETIFLIWS